MSVFWRDYNDIKALVANLDYKREYEIRSDRR